MSSVDVVDYVATIKRAPNEQSNLVVIPKVAPIRYLRNEPKNYVIISLQLFTCQMLRQVAADH